MLVGARSRSWGCSDPSRRGVAHPGEGGSRESASQETTTPAALATTARCSGVKFGAGFDFILNIGMPLGVSRLAQFRARPVGPRGTAYPRPAGYRGPGAGRNVLVPPIGAGRNAEAMLPRLGGWGY